MRFGHSFRRSLRADTRENGTAMPVGHVGRHSWHSTPSEGVGKNGESVKAGREICGRGAMEKTSERESNRAKKRRQRNGGKEMVAKIQQRRKSIAAVPDERRAAMHDVEVP